MKYIKMYPQANPTPRIHQTDLLLSQTTEKDVTTTTSGRLRPLAAMTIVYFPKEISALSSDSHNNFTSIIGIPSDDDVQRLCRRNFAALQDIDIGNVTDATGIILFEDDHKAANRGQVFDRADGALGAYDPSIMDDDNNAVRLSQEKTWSCKLDFQAVIRTAELVGKKFVLSRVE